METEKIIKCICGGKAKLFVRETKLFDGRVVIKDDEGYKCTRCGDVFFTSKQMRKFEKQLREKYFFKRQVISTGRSLAITFPHDFVEFYNLKKGKTVEIIPQGAKEARLKFK